MRARTIYPYAYAAFAVFAAFVRFTNAQNAYIYVDVDGRNHTLRPKNEPQNLETYTSDLSKDLERAKEDALLLYTEYTSKAGVDLKNFLRNISFYADDAVDSINSSIKYDNETHSCRRAFDARLKKIEYDAQRSASFSAENHHKYLLGHMIVFRMHINKSEDYIKKSDRVLRSCGSSCEITPRVKRWRRLAAEEMHRVRDDLQHSRKSYHDLVTHARRKLIHFRKQITVRSVDAVEKYHMCLLRGNY